VSDVGTPDSTALDATVNVNIHTVELRLSELIKTRGGSDK